jgi:hypothetical protein
MGVRAGTSSPCLYRDIVVVLWRRRQSGDTCGYLRVESHWHFQFRFDHPNPQHQFDSGGAVVQSVPCCDFGSLALAGRVNRCCLRQRSGLNPRSILTSSFHLCFTPEIIISLHHRCKYVGYLSERRGCRFGTVVERSP